MRASAWLGTLGLAAFGSTVMPATINAQEFNDRNHEMRQDVESSQSWRGGGRHDSDWRGDRRRDWRERDERYGTRGSGYWGGRAHYWGWAPPPPAVYWAPPPRVVYYKQPRYRVDRLDAFDVVALGLFSAVVISALSDNERRSHERTYSRALSAPVGESIVWNDRQASGSVRVTRDGYAGDKYCREFQQSIVVGGERQDAWGISCQEPDGSWRIMPN